MYCGSELWKRRMPLALEERTLRSGQRVETWNDLPASLYAAVAQNAARMPEKLAVADSFGRKLRYRQLLELSDRTALALHARLGVHRGSHVALMVYSSAEFAALYLALNRLGAVAVMLPTKYKASEIRALAERAELDAVICDTDYSDYFRAERARGIPVYAYHAQQERFGLAELFTKPCTEPENAVTCLPADPSPAGTPVDGGLRGGAALWKGASREQNDLLRAYPEAKAEDVAVMMFTSGTTSLSKGVMLTNLALMHAAAVYQYAFSLTAEDSTVLPVPIYMITGLSALFGTMLCAGGTVYLQQFFSAEAVLRCVQERSITFLHAAPTVYTLLLAEKEAFPKLPSLRCAACGGGWSARQLIEAMHGWLPGCEFRTVYGMTETASPATILPEDAAGSPHPESNGLPIPGLCLKIVDETGAELPCGAVGEIVMRGANLLTGYYHLDTPLLHDGWLRTGDVGYVTEDGYCHVVDRVKDMINRGGEKVVSSDVEKALLDIEGVLQAAVVGIRHAVYGEAPAALVVCAEGSGWNGEGLRARLKGQIAGYKIPVKICLADSIPLTPNGKYDKKAIRLLFRTDENGV